MRSHAGERTRAARCADDTRRRSLVHRQILRPTRRRRAPWSIIVGLASPTKFARSGCRPTTRRRRRFHPLRKTRGKLARIELPAAGDARRMIKQLSGDWSAAELPHRCLQTFIEPVLYKHASKLSSVSLRHGVRLTGFTDRGDHVEVSAARVADASPFVLRVTWLVGCDGPRSLVRRQLGISYVGEAGVQRDFMVANAHVAFSRAAPLRNHSGMEGGRRAFNCERRSFMCSIDGRGEFVFHTQIKAGDEDVEVSDARAHAMLEQAIGAPCPVEILGRSAWPQGSRWRRALSARARPYLAGDAAHLFTPSGGGSDTTPESKTR